MSEVIDVNGGATVLFHEGVGMSFFTESTRLRGGKFGPTSSEKVDPNVGTGDVAYWGSDNAWPQQVVAEVNDSDILRPLIRKQAKMMTGQGLVYGTTTIDATTGEEKMNVMQVQEIDRHLKRTNINLYLYESWCDWFTQGNVFPELQTDFEGNVVGLYAQDATRCRLSKKDNLGRITKCYISGAWDQGGGLRSDKTITLPALDPYYDVAGQIRNSKQGRFIMPIRLLVDDQDYYGQAPWHGLISSGWLEVAKAIPKLKKHLMQNMMFIKYHIEIAQEYWPLQYPGWEKMTQPERSKKKKDRVDDFTKWAAGLEKAGRTLMTEKVLDEIKKEQYRSLWTVTPLKLEIPTGAYVEDSQEADFHIVRAFMDPSLFGIAPGKDRNSAGSGSDKRIAHTHHVLDNYVDAQMILSPLDVMAEVNGWHEKHGGGQMLKFWFKAYHAATLDRTLGAVSEKAQTEEN